MDYKNRNAAIYRKWKDYTSMTSGACEICQAYLLYSFEYDASFCPGCNDWREKTCSDPECSYCSERPQTPEEFFFTSNYLAAKERMKSMHADEVKIKHRKRRWNTIKKKSKSELRHH